MIIGLLTLELSIAEANSLKDKRSVLNRVKDRVHNKFNVSIAEVGAHDVWNYALLGVVVLSNEQKHANQVLCKIADFVEGLRVCELDDFTTEFIPAG